MVADTRKMYELKLKIKDMLKKEKHICDMFNGMVEGSLLKMDKLDEFIQLGKCPERRDEIKTLTKEEVMSNPYLKNIEIPNVELNNIRLLKKRIIFANTITTYNEKRRNSDTFREVNSYFVCDRTLRFPAIVEGESNVPWMTVEPMEINSFEPFIKEANGNILLCGCGLGYVAYMLSLKEDVKSVTIIELNEDIIELFTNYILPQFENKDKIKVIHTDALEYLHNNDLSSFDYVNVDIWRDTLDMIYMYLPCLELEDKYPNIKFSYWLENELKSMIQKSILQAIAEYEDKGLLFDAIGKDIVKNTEIKNSEDIRDCLELSDFREVLKMWYKNNPELYESLKAASEKYMENLMTKSAKLINKLKNK